MNATDPDPIQRWRSIAGWYAEFAAQPDWEFLAPMIGLAAWVAEQPFAGPLLPCTSHEWLCVQLHMGYNPERPFFSCGTQEDGQFEFSLWENVGRRLAHRLVSLDETRATFEDFVVRLTKLAGKID